MFLPLSRYVSSFQRYVGILLLLLAPVGLAGQTSVQDYATPSALAGLIQASDGNYYGVDTDYFDSYASLATSTKYIYEITPAGVVTRIATFAPATAGTNGLGPQSLVQGPDGFLYGVTQVGGPNSCNTGNSAYQQQNCGVFFKLALGGGGFTVLHSFTSAEVGTGILNGALVLANDGYFYGAGTGGTPNSGYASGSVYRVSPTGAASLVHTFTSAEDPGPVGSLIQGTDGFLYGATAKNVLCGAYPASAAPDCGKIFRLSTSGQLATAYALPNDFTQGFNFDQTPVQGPDGSFYGTVDEGPSPANSPYIYKLTPSGQFQSIYTLTGAHGNYTSFSVGGDLNLYSSVYNSPRVYRVTTSGSYTDLHDFTGGTDGGAPVGNLLTASDGDLLGATVVSSTGPGVIFDLATKLPAPVQLSFTMGGTPLNVVTTSVPPGTQLVLNWNVLNAFSLSMQQCYAFIANSPTGAGVWTGKQAGTVSGTNFTGSAMITPTAPGMYTYALTCGGVEAGNITLVVSNVVTITTTALPNATVGQSYSQALVAIGGTTPYTWSSTGAGLPGGLGLDGNLGVISGKPTQFGSSTLTFQVTDSSTPPLTANATLALGVLSGLQITTTTLAKATVGSNYSQPLAGTGGTPPYIWTLASGALPDGLVLSQGTGVISGKPTTAGSSNISVKVTDSEGISATTTAAFTLVVAPAQLTVTTTSFAAATVGTAYSQTLTAVGGTTPYTWALLGGTLPKGLALSTAGILSGTPAQFAAGNTLTVQVTDSATPAQQATGSVVFDIKSGLAITTGSLPAGITGTTYTANLTGTGGLTPYKWSVLSGTLPAGLTLDSSSGIVSGKPTTAGTTTFSIQLLDAEVSAATSTMAYTVTIAAPPLATTTTVLTSSFPNAGVGQSVVLTATVVGTAAAPTGSVTFYNGTAVLGTGVLGTGLTGAPGTATLTTSFSTAGTYALTATYGGDGTSTGSTSAQLSQLVVTVGVSASISPSSLTITSGQKGTLTLAVTPTGGYKGVVSFTCGNLPAKASCTFTPPSVTLDGTGTPMTSTLVINTASTQTALLGEFGGRSGGIAAAMLFGFFALLGKRKRLPRAWIGRLALLVLVLGGATAAATMLTGCGGGSLNNTAPGTYNVAIQLTLAGQTATTQVNATIIVQ